jgi:ankyrin repeat protein
MPDPQDRVAMGEQLIGAFETHSVDEIRALLDLGLDPREPIRGKPPMRWLTEMYMRSGAFAACVRLMLDRGAVLDDPVLAPVLIDDPDALEDALCANSAMIAHRTTMVSAFTPLDGASLLHVAAEYGHLEAARVLVRMGADLNARAAVDAQGLNGQTPLFHTVCSLGNHGQPVLRLLLEAGASADLALPGIVWGRGFEWETTFFDVTPLSYAQIGLMPQVHRRERDVYENIALLLEATHRKPPPLPNVPNRYLQPKRRG